ncbi:MAG TPA: hypothetical protein V6D08_02315, partial [Candidatus Obscuribacterales bacterium]
YNHFGVDPAVLAPLMEAPGERLTPEQLTDLSARMGLKPPMMLAYSRNGKLFVTNTGATRK